MVISALPFLALLSSLCDEAISLEMSSVNVNVYSVFQAILESIDPENRASFSLIFPYTTRSTLLTLIILPPRPVGHRRLALLLCG